MAPFEMRTIRCILTSGRRLGAGLSVALVASTSGCAAVLGPVNCTDELRVKLTPPVTTLAIGSSFTPGVSLTTCGGRKRLTDTFTYESTNLATAVVDPTTGRVTGVGVGESDIVITGQRQGNVGRIRVTVTR